MEAIRKGSLPASVLGKAAHYAFSQWRRLVQFLDHPEVELSNNAAANMRLVALEGKNWIHVGSGKAGPKVGAILSITESCRWLKIPIREYLADVLTGRAESSGAAGGRIYACCLECGPIESPLVSL